MKIWLISVKDAWDNYYTYQNIACDSFERARLWVKEYYPSAIKHYGTEEYELYDYQWDKGHFEIKIESLNLITSGASE